MNEQEIRKENEKVLRWAEMSDMEFFFRYFEDADVKEMEEFRKLFPEFLREEEN